MKQTLWTIAELFKGRILAVPDYQRGYAWEEAQLQDLIEDLDVLRPGQVHYAGTVVLHEQDEEVRDVARNRHVVHHVVDGQQRLTTLTILLETLRREVIALEGEDSVRAEALRTTYLWVFRPNSEMRISKLRLAESLGEHFESHVLREERSLDEAQTLSARRLDDAKRFFGKYFRAKREELSDRYFQWLDGIQEKVTEQLQVTLFPVEAEGDVGVIFEVMNNRGKPLSELEKVKNYLLYVAAKLESKGLASRVNQTWARVLKLMMEGELLRRDDEDRLLRTHWLLTQDHDESKWEGYRSIKARFDLRSRLSDDARGSLEGEIDRYLTTLQETVIVMRDIDRPERREAFASFSEDHDLRREIALWSERLHRLGNVATFRSFLAAVLMKHRDARSYLDAVKACELFSFLTYKVANLRSNSGRTSFNWVGRRVYLGEESLEKTLEHIKSWTGGYCKRATYDYFWELDEKNPRDFYRWGALRYLLYEWELNRVGNKEVRVSWKVLHDKQPQTTIEHVLPQTPDDEYWTSRFDEQAITLYTHDLGNLSLTEDNSSYGNKPFPEKRGAAGATRRCYARSLLTSEQDLATWEEWTPEVIQERRQQLVTWAQERWPHPGSDAINENSLADEAEDSVNGPPS